MTVRRILTPFKDKQESFCFQISVEKDVVGRGAIRSMLTPFWKIKFQTIPPAR
jgi:hypothetical protein